MGIERAATAANTQSLRDDGREIKSGAGAITAADRIRWWIAVRDTPLEHMFGPRGRADDLTKAARRREARQHPARAMVLAIAAEVVATACGGEGLFWLTPDELAERLTAADGPNSRGVTADTTRKVLKGLAAASLLLPAGTLTYGRRRWRLVSPDSGGSTPESGRKSPGTDRLGTPESGGHKESKRDESESARARVERWFARLPHSRWGELFHQHRRQNEPFQSWGWRERACSEEWG